jgi:diguanylate cyclase (GGDEF)-like protein
MLTYPMAVAVARWLAIDYLLVLTPPTSASRHIRLALLLYGVVTTLFAGTYRQRVVGVTGTADSHPLVIPALVLIDAVYALLGAKLYGVTIMAVIVGLDAAWFTIPVGLSLACILDLGLIGLATHSPGEGATSIAMRTAALTFAPYCAALYGILGRRRAERQLRAIDAVLHAGSELGAQVLLGDVLVQLRNLLGQFRRVVPWNTCLIYVVEYDEASKEEMLVAVEAAGDDATDYRGTKLAFGTGLVGHCAAKQRSLLVADLHKDPRQPDATLRPHARGCLIVPIISEGQTVGCVQLLSVRTNAYNEEQLGLVSRLVSLAAVGVRNALLHSRTRAIADTDALTGLLAPRAYHERLELEFRKAQAMRTSLSLLLIDLDNFKMVNDKHGHLAGDELLRRLGVLLREQARREDICCRYGGDEFIIVMPGTIKSEAALVAQRIRKAIEDMRFVFEGVQVGVTVSIGVASYPQDVTTKQGLLKAADKALYGAKATGRNALRVFGPGRLS